NMVTAAKRSYNRTFDLCKTTTAQFHFGLLLVCWLVYKATHSLTLSLIVIHVVHAVTGLLCMLVAIGAVCCCLFPLISVLAVSRAGLTLPRFLRRGTILQGSDGCCVWSSCVSKFVHAASMATVSILF